MRSVYEREVRNYQSPAKENEEVVRTTYTRTRADRSPISTTRQEVIDGLSGAKKTTITYEGPTFVSKTTIEKKDEEPREEYVRYERTRNDLEGTEEIRRTTTRVEASGSKPVEEVRRTVVTETSPARGLKTTTRVVYEGDPSYRATRVERSEYERTSPLRTYTRTVETKSPLRSATKIHETVREENDPAKGYTREVVRREISPDRTVVTRTIRESPVREEPAKPERSVREEERQSAKLSATKVNREVVEERHSAKLSATKSLREPQAEEPRPADRASNLAQADKSVHSRSIRESHEERDPVASRGSRVYQPERSVRDQPVPEPARESRGIPARVREEEEVPEPIAAPVERTIISRTTREVTPGKAVTTTRVVKESPNYKESTYTRTREDSPGRLAYTRTVTEDGPSGERRVYTTSRVENEEIEEKPAPVYQRYERRVEELPDRFGTTRREITTTISAKPEEDYPVRRRQPDAEEDVVVLRYTSPYKA